MGKTKTAFVAEAASQEGKTSEQKYKEKREKQKKEEETKVHISGLKGGQRVKVVSAEEPTSEGTPTTEETAKGKIIEKIRSKKYQTSKAKIEPGKKYKVSEAIKLVKETSYSKFDGTMELHIVVKKSGINFQVTLPHSAGKAKKVEVADDSTLKKIETGKIDFEILLATAEMMPKLVPFAKVLGPRGLMPNPKNGTVIKSAKDAEKFGGNSQTIKTEKDAPLIHTVVGKVSQKDSELEENINEIVKVLQKDKQIERAFLKSTMSPSVKLEI
jgi:large subunit ribosomal protein L1